MTEPYKGEHASAGDIAAAARDKGIEQLEGAKGQLADGAERVAAAVERTAEELEGEGGETVSGFGRSLAGLMRQLAGGLRERDVEEFASELGALARRNPGVFLAGSVALGFGVARFFKARAPYARTGDDQEWRAAGDSSRASRDDFDGDESLDLSANPTGVERRSEDDGGAPDASRMSAGEQSREAAGDRPPSRRSGSKGNKTKPQRASTGAAEPLSEGPSLDSSAKDSAAAEGSSPFSGATGGSAVQGGKES